MQRGLLRTIKGLENCNADAFGEKGHPVSVTDTHKGHLDQKLYLNDW